MTKYKILKNDSIYYDGVTLYRIQSICDFDDVQFGDIGWGGRRKWVKKKS